MNELIVDALTWAYVHIDTVTPTLLVVSVTLVSIVCGRSKVRN